MISDFKILFENRSRVTDFSFWAELGLSDNNKVLRLAPEGSLVQKIFASNEWVAFEKIVYQDVTAADGEIRQVIKCTPRKGHKQEIQNNGVFLKINLDANINEAGNLPSLMQQYILGLDERKLNLVVGLVHKIEVPANSYCGKFTQMTLSKEIMQVENDYTPNPVFNIFRLHLTGKREK